MKRRTFLTTVSTATVTTISGCLSESIDEYPKGLTESKIQDLSAVVGENAHYMSAESATINMSSTGPSGTTIITSKVDATIPAVFIKSRKKLPESIESDVGDQIIEEFYVKDKAYLRRFVESEPNDIDYRNSKYTFDKSQEFYANYLLQLIKNVVYSEHEKTEQNILVYTASGSDFSKNSSFDHTQLDTITSTLQFFGDGKIKQFNINKKSETEDTKQEIKFSKYNQTSVREPNWTIHAKNN